MVKHVCHRCDKVFKQKCHLIDHLNKKNLCEKIENDEKEKIHDLLMIENNEKTKIDYNDCNNNLTTEKIKKLLDECICAYCEKKFSRRDIVIRHMNESCKKVKKIESEKDNIMKRLLEKIDKLEEKIDKVNEENKNLKTIITNNTQSITNNEYENNIENNSQNNYFDNSQHIVLVGYTKEDFDKIGNEDFIKILKRGFQAPIELTKSIHFNPQFPEYHNIFIPKMNEKHGMFFDGKNWRLIHKDELAEDIYERKRSHIIENWETFADHLTEPQKKALKRWLSSKDDKDAEILKEDIKRVLYENRKLPMEKKKEIEYYEKINKQKKLKNITSLYDNKNIKKPISKKYISKNSDED
jgi:hypothetical protein